MTEKTETKQSGDTASKDGDRGIKVIGILCNWCSYAGADSAGTARLKQPVDLRIVRTPCTGRIDPIFALKAFEKGADGVLVSGCHPGDCHYAEGNYYARRRLELLDKTIQQLQAAPSVVVPFSIVTVTRVASTYQHPVGALLKRLEGKDRIYAPRAGSSDDTQVHWLFQAGRARGIGTRITAPVAENTDDFDAPVSVLAGGVAGLFGFRLFSHRHRLSKRGELPLSGL